VDSRCSSCWSPCHCASFSPWATVHQQASESRRIGRTADEAARVANGSAGTGAGFVQLRRVPYANPWEAIPIRGVDFHHETTSSSRRNSVIASEDARAGRAGAAGRAAARRPLSRRIFSTTSCVVLLEVVVVWKSTPDRNRFPRVAYGTRAAARKSCSSTALRLNRAASSAVPEFDATLDGWLMEP